MKSGVLPGMPPIFLQRLCKAVTTHNVSPDFFMCRQAPFPNWSHLLLEGIKISTFLGYPKIRYKTSLKPTTLLT